MRVGWNKLSIVGNKFGRLTVLNEVKSDNKFSHWLCVCECGNTKIIQGRSLTSGNTKTCGQCPKKAHNATGCGDISGTYWAHLRRGAKQRNKEFSVTIEEAWGLFLKQIRKCAISGVDLKFVSNYNEFAIEQTASLDRIDSSKAYFVGNVQWIHKDVNIMKSSLDEDNFYNWCEVIYKNRLERLS